MMKHLVIDVLSLPAISGFSFSFNGVAIDGTKLRAVRTAVEDGSIGVNHSNRIGHESVRYSYKRNRFDFGFHSAKGQIFREAAIMHESVHAALDLMNIRRSLLDSETAAYIIECMFVYQNRFIYGEGGVGHFLRPQLKSLSPILNEAWTIVTTADGNPALTNTALDPLRQAISAYPSYYYRLDSILDKAPD